MLSTVLAEAKAYFCSFCVYSLTVMVLSCEDLLYSFQGCAQSALARRSATLLMTTTKNKKKQNKKIFKKFI